MKIFPQDLSLLQTIFLLQKRSKRPVCRFPGGLEQWSARKAHNLEVAGSSPAPAIDTKLLCCAYS
jgi:hypothetical protein